MLQDFKSVSDHFGPLCTKGLSHTFDIDEIYMRYDFYYYINKSNEKQTYFLFLSLCFVIGPLKKVKE